MKRVSLFRGASYLALLSALIIQGCGGSGGSGTESVTRPNSNDGGPAIGGSASSKIGVHPAAGPAGSTIAVSGKGFAGACGASLYLGQAGGESLGKATIRDGEFMTQGNLPESVGSGDLMIAGELLESDGQGCTKATGEVFQASFEVTGEMPIIMLAQIDGRPGTAVAVDGRNFCADAECSPVTILIDGQVAGSDIAVGEDGTFIAEAIVPAIDAAGPVAVVALQLAADGTEHRAFGELTVTVKPDQDPVIQ